MPLLVRGSPTGRGQNKATGGTSMETCLQPLLLGYSEGWVHDPTWNQSKRAKPTHTDPEDDTKVDSTMPIGTTSKTWNPKSDGQFWHEQSGNEGYRGIFDAVETTLIR